MGRAVVTGGAGFVGSHLCDRLLADGWEVVCFDSLLTGNAENLAAASAHSHFRWERVDVTEPLSVDGDVDWVLHFASPASPKDYFNLPLETLDVGSTGTRRCLELAREKGAGFFLASTSEVYGNPEVHPQPESYWGNVNSVGPRAVYDEAKRFAEALSTSYGSVFGLPVKIVRIFNTYGPRMKQNDGRAVPNFISQALRGDFVTVHGDGSQTRSLCYVDDLVDGIVRFLGSDATGPMNLGNPEEVKILELAHLVCDAVGSRSDLVFTQRPEDDPDLRCPDITRARMELGWEPRIQLQDGLDLTVEWARENWR
jgi:nucleoside-diphosphate-sugar epimerase